MRRFVWLILLVLLAACAADSSGLTPDEASVVATITDGAKADQIESLAEVLRSDAIVQAVSADVGKGTFLVLFGEPTTFEQRKAVFNRLASSGLFSSIQCATCSQHR